MATKSFRAAQPNRIPHAIALTGYYTDDRTGDDGEPAQWVLDLEFVPAAAFADVNAVLASIGTRDGKMVANGINVERFLVNCATDASRPKLDALFQDHARAVDLQTLADMAVWLIGLYSGADGAPGRNPTIG